MCNPEECVTSDNCAEDDVRSPSRCCVPETTPWSATLVDRIGAKARPQLRGMSRMAGGGCRLAVHIMTPVLFVWVGACSGQPTAPQPPASIPPVTGPHQVSGVLVTNQTRSPIAGAAMRLSGISLPAATTTVTTGPSGEFTFPSVPADRMWLSISAPGHLDRVTFLRITGSRQDLVVDLIATAPPFSLNFFRQFARNGFEQPSGLSQLHPWSTDPSFYVRTVVEDTGELVSPVVVEGLRRIFTNAVPELSAGLLKVAGFEAGQDARPFQPGWVTVTFVRSLVPGGQATLGPGMNRWMKIRYDPARDERPLFSGCESGMVEVADHEIVHTMGYSHTDDVYRDFHSGKDCSGVGRPDRVRYHAAVMYSRAHGNRDPDKDPASFAIPAAVSGAPVVVSCPAHLFRSGGADLPALTLAGSLLLTQPAGRRRIAW